MIKLVAIQHTPLRTMGQSNFAGLFCIERTSGRRINSNYFHSFVAKPLLNSRISTGHDENDLAIRILPRLRVRKAAHHMAEADLFAGIGANDERSHVSLS